jgi:sugar lactone lactonase YvrE
MLGLEFDQAGDLYVAMNSGNAETHGVWKVSSDGSKQELFAGLKAGTFPNVVTFDSEGNLYVSDTIGGEVFKVDQGGTVSSWKQDQLMVGKVPPQLMAFPIGANGLVFDKAGENLYVANTEFGRIVRIPVNADGSAGEATVFFEDLEKMGLPDGMIIDDAGNLYVAVVGNDRIVKISPQGDLTILGEGFPLQNPSDLRFGVGDDAGTLYVANFALFRMLGLAPGTPSPGILKLKLE